MHPQPVSDENPVWSPNEVLRRIAKDNAEAALGSVDLGITSNPVRYVIHIRDSKSSKKAGGQPLSWLGSSYASDESKLLASESGGVSITCCLVAPGAAIEAGAAAVVVVAVSTVPSAGGVPVVNGDGVPDPFAPSVYERPRHQTGSLESRSLIGSGSHIFCNIRRLTRPASAPTAIATSIAFTSFGDVLEAADCQRLFPCRCGVIEDSVSRLQ